MRWDGFSAVRDAEQKEYCCEQDKWHPLPEVAVDLVVINWSLNFWIWAQNYETLFHKLLFYLVFFFTFFSPQILERKGGVWVRHCSEDAVSMPFEYMKHQGKLLNMWTVIWAFIVSVIKNQCTTKKEHGLKGLSTHFNLQTSTEIYVENPNSGKLRV